MDTNYKEPTQGNIHAWAKEWYTINEKKRSIFMVSVEYDGENDKLKVLHLTQGKKIPLLAGLAGAMHKSESIAELVCRAALKYSDEAE